MSAQYFLLYGVPCGLCTHPAHHIEVYPNGVRTVHMDPRKRPCDSVRPARKHPDRRGPEPRAPQVPLRASAPVRRPAFSGGRSA